MEFLSGLANAATAVTAVLVYLLDWGRYAEATIVTVKLLFFAFSAANHVATPLLERNLIRSLLDGQGFRTFRSGVKANRGQPSLRHSQHPQYRPLRCPAGGSVH